jgi:hypothetical protein
MRMTEPAPRGPGCLSRLHCDQLLNGELTDRDDLVRHPASCARCSALLDEHRRERAQFAVPLRRPRHVPRWVAGLASVAAAVAIWLIVARPEAPPETTRSKGKPALGFYLKRGDLVRRGGTGEVVFPHDALDFTMSTDHGGFVAILSVDGARHASVYYAAGALAAAIGAGQDQLLPLSVVLDDVVGPERVVGVVCDRAVTVDELARAVERDAALPEGCVSDALTLDKRSAP